MEREEETTRRSLRTRIPPLPGPVADGDGWEAIDRIGAEAAFRVCCPMLQYVDTQHSSAWARAHGYVLRR